MPTLFHTTARSSGLDPAINGIDLNIRVEAKNVEADLDCSIAFALCNMATKSQGIQARVYGGRNIMDTM